MQSQRIVAAPPPYRAKSRLAMWIPFGLRRIDFYYMRFYIKAFLIILFALISLIAISDLFQRFNDFVSLSQREDQTFSQSLMLFLTYFGTFVPQMVFQYMLPVVMVLAAAITITSSFAGPRGNNEYVVIRSVGVPVLRSFFPLVFTAFVVALAFQATRDYFLPGMVRESSAILGRLRNRTAQPVNLSLSGPDGHQSISVGNYAPGDFAHNIIIEVRDEEQFLRGAAELGDNDFIAYRAPLARLEAVAGGGGKYQWVPLEHGQRHEYTRYVRRETPWTEPIPTNMTPAMIERQNLGDAVSGWQDLNVMRSESTSARFELNWRLADPLACALLVVWGAGVIMGRMLRGRTPSYIQSIATAMIVAGVFYAIRLGGRSLFESGMLSPSMGVWLPVAFAAVVALVISLWVER
ncbi:MAG: LptF/LptG family permease [Planctomycetes bacterium]|nr:LptF/LptG family permease [Planctomycetota bacterium]